MHRSHQPLKPASNRFLQRRWDQNFFREHRCQVREAKPVVDTKGVQTPLHIQQKLKKVQLQEERKLIIQRDNHHLANNLTAITHSKGLVDHRNHYQHGSLNGQKRMEKLLQVTHENQEIYQRIAAQKSDYRRELWVEDWEITKRRRDAIAHYPRGLTNKQKLTKVVKFSGVSQPSSSAVEDDSGETTEEEPQPAT